MEHSADLYLSRRKPVLPIDLAIGQAEMTELEARCGLAKHATSRADRILPLCPTFANTEGAALAGIATRNGAVPATEIADGTTIILSKIAQPDAFYVRLLNPTHRQFHCVESFFREVVDPVVHEAGMNRIEIGTDKSEYAFINVAIFESLHFSSLAIVDVTGERPNCFIELGYALGTATVFW